MVLDALLTALVGLNTRSNEILLAAVIMPLASGTAPACKGVCEPQTIRLCRQTLIFKLCLFHRRHDGARTCRATQ